MHSVNEQGRRRNIGADPLTIIPDQLEQDGVHILFDPACIQRPDGHFFEAEYWRRQGAVRSVAEGRGAACIFQYQGQALVLRHYRRGGLMARFSDDRYLWMGLDRTRAWREWHLLADMFGQGLPVPHPVAARVQRHGLFYSADLVTLCIPGVTPLADLLMQQVLSETQWRLIGATVQRFHQAGVYHADLNARNILLDPAGQVFVIDFDKGERRTPQRSWQQANLARLRRSLDRFLVRQGRFHFDEQAWQWLLAGYDK